MNEEQIQQPTTRPQTPTDLPSSRKIPSRCAQIGILLKKILQFQRRKFGFYLFHILIVPIVFCFLLYLNYNIQNQSVLLSEEFYKPRSMNGLSKCQGKDNCLTLGTVLISQDESQPQSPWITHVINELKNRFDLQDEEDVDLIYKGVIPKDIQKSIDKYQEVKNVLYFCNDYDIFRNATISVNCDQLSAYSFYKIDLNLYGIAYNQTKISPSFIVDFNLPLKVDENAILLKKTIDEILIEYYRDEKDKGVESDSFNINKGFKNSYSYEKDKTVNSQNSVDNGDVKKDNSFTYDFDLMSFMKPKTSFLLKFDASVEWGPFFYVFIILLSFSQITKVIAQEKGNKLRQGLIPFGLSGFAYWMSWLIYLLGFNLLLTLYIMLVGFIFNILMFHDGLFFINFFVIYTCAISYSCLAMFIVSCCPEYKIANNITYTIIIVSIFLQIFVCQRGIQNLFFLEDRPFLLNLISFILSFLPSYAFSIIISNINFMIGFHLDPLTFNYIKGPGYNITTYFTPTDSVNKMTGSIHKPSDFYFHMWLCLITIIYVIGLWIADNKIESNNGYRRHLFFRKKKKNERRNSTAVLDEPLLDDKNESQKEFFVAEKINKIYKLNLRGTKTIHALKDFSISIKDNEVIALLGENGAGKSTFISILTGILKANSGKLFYRDRLFGTKQSDKLLVSVCPQYDILWRELSVEENMTLIGKFRGMNEKEIHQQIDYILAQMDLLDQKKVVVGSLSGGMRRRISVGVALIGNPELLIFDEPTTGLDPVNRKSVWNFIKELKNTGKTVLLTTHIMDEADYLADTVAIINKGNLLINKTAVEIKNQFNKLNVVFALKKYSDEFFETLTALFDEYYNSTYNLKFKSERLIKFNIPNDNLDTMKRFVKVLEDLSLAEKYSMMVDYIDSFEVASLDLEEAYMLVNENN